jgi:hypothetical protein
MSRRISLPANEISSACDLDISVASISVAAVAVTENTLPPAVTSWFVVGSIAVPA